ncbi:hypothetical protein CYY_000600 [Polysphondylium violaceum]|uniref:Uncharacterized protein n=1 Tax=Polysphondylium violaceum TaxID=133409 RepID=A0A8J4Q4K7_9MYCE|nr:hypothetical protein CYY_000600 [Polysphondylium violaceum]
MIPSNSRRELNRDDSFMLKHCKKFENSIKNTSTYSEQEFNNLNDIVSFVLDSTEQYTKIKTNGIMLVGPSGSGKSTFLDFLSGAQINVENDGIYARNPIQSCKLNSFLPNLYSPCDISGYKDTTFIDYPSNDKNGPLYEILKESTKLKIANSCSNIKILFVIQQSDLTDGRGGIILGQTADKLKSLVGDISDLYENIFLVVSKADPSQDILEQINACLNHINKQDNGELGNFKPILQEIIDNNRFTAFCNPPVYSTDNDLDYVPLSDPDLSRETLLALIEKLEYRDIKGSNRFLVKSSPHLKNMVDGYYHDGPILGAISIVQRNVIEQFNQYFEKISKQKASIDIVNIPTFLSTLEQINDFINLNIDEITFQDFCYQLISKLLPLENYFPSSKIPLDDINEALSIPAFYSKFSSNPFQTLENFNFKELFQFNKLFTSISNDLNSIKQPVYKIQGSDLICFGYDLRFSDVVSKVDNNINNIEIIALNQIDIDHDLTGPSTNLSIYSPVWNITRKCEINLSATSNLIPAGVEESNDYLNNGPARGLPGLPGSGGGNFYGVGQVFAGIKNLSITSNGGNGGTGGSGEVGINTGIPINFLNPSTVNIQGQMVDSTNYEIQQSEMNAPIKNELLVNFMKQHWITNEGTFIAFIIKDKFYGLSNVGSKINRFERILFDVDIERIGDEDYPGGVGGIGGLGGHSGQVCVLNLNDNTDITNQISVIRLNGGNGPNGIRGKYGPKGIGKKEVKITFSHNFLPNGSSNPTATLDLLLPETVSNAPYPRSLFASFNSDNQNQPEPHPNNAESSKNSFSTFITEKNQAFNHIDIMKSTFIKKIIHSDTEDLIDDGDGSISSLSTSSLLESNESDDEFNPQEIVSPDDLTFSQDNIPEPTLVDEPMHPDLFVSNLEEDDENQDDLYLSNLFYISEPIVENENLLESNIIQDVEKDSPSTILVEFDTVEKNLDINIENETIQQTIEALPEVKDAIHHVIDTLVKSNSFGSESESESVSSQEELLSDQEKESTEDPIQDKYCIIETQVLENEPMETEPTINLESTLDIDGKQISVESEPGSSQEEILSDQDSQENVSSENCIDKNNQDEKDIDEALESQDQPINQESTLESNILDETIVVESENESEPSFSPDELDQESKELAENPSHDNSMIEFKEDEVLESQDPTINQESTLGSDLFVEKEISEDESESGSSQEELLSDQGCQDEKDIDEDLESQDQPINQERTLESNILDETIVVESTEDPIQDNYRIIETQVEEDEPMETEPTINQENTLESNILDESENESGFSPKKLDQESELTEDHIHDNSMIEVKEDEVLESQDPTINQESTLGSDLFVEKDRETVAQSISHDSDAYIEDCIQDDEKNIPDKYFTQEDEEHIPEVETKEAECPLHDSLVDNLVDPPQENNTIVETPKDQVETLSHHPYHYEDSGAPFENTKPSESKDDIDSKQENIVVLDNLLPDAKLSQESISLLENNSYDEMQDDKLESESVSESESSESELSESDQEEKSIQDNDIKYSPDIIVEVDSDIVEREEPIVIDQKEPIDVHQQPTPKYNFSPVQDYSRPTNFSKSQTLLTPTPTRPISKPPSTPLTTLIKNQIPLNPPRPSTPKKSISERISMFEKLAKESQQTVTIKSPAPKRSLDQLP